MKFKSTLTLLLLLALNIGYSQKSKNQVKLPAISIKYEGDTKKGLANGKGEAWGEQDHYKGEFKKGLPHGEGKYTWGNGNIYEGEFSKGEMDGKGKLIIMSIDKSTSKTEEGYFKDNEYIGIYKDPYKIVTDGGARNINFQKKAGTIDQVTFELFSNGKSISPGALNIRDNNNSLVQTVNGFKTITNPSFPLERIEISFTVDKTSYSIILDVYQKGVWHVIISV